MNVTLCSWMSASAPSGSNQRMRMPRVPKRYPDTRALRPNVCASGRTSSATSLRSRVVAEFHPFCAFERRFMWVWTTPFGFPVVPLV